MHAVPFPHRSDPFPLGRGSASVPSGPGPASIPSASGSVPFELQVEPGPVAGTTRVTVAVADRPGLLALIAGCLTLARLDIVSASIVQVAGTARDEFLVTVGEGAGADPWRDLREALAGALEGRVTLADRFPGAGAVPGAGDVRVEADSEFTTGIRVKAPDRLGLLHDLALAMSRLGLDIRAISLLTISGMATDTFRVRERDTGLPPKDPARLEQIRCALLAVV